MSTETIAALVGAIVGSVLTFILSQWAGARQEKHQTKLRLLGILMSQRGNIFSHDVSSSVNLIPIVFHDDNKARRSHQHFCATLGTTSGDYLKRYIELTLEIAKSLGYSKSLTEADLYSGFFLPQQTDQQGS